MSDPDDDFERQLSGALRARASAPAPSRLEHEVLARVRSVSEAGPRWPAWLNLFAGGLVAACALLSIGHLLQHRSGAHRAPTVLSTKSQRNASAAPTVPSTGFSSGAAAPVQLALATPGHRATLRQASASRPKPAISVSERPAIFPTPERGRPSIFGAALAERAQPISQVAALAFDDLNREQSRSIRIAPLQDQPITMQE